MNDYVPSNHLCKKLGCAAVRIGPWGYCETHDLRTPWGELTRHFHARVTVMHGG